MAEVSSEGLFVLKRGLGFRGFEARKGSGLYARVWGGRKDFGVSLGSRGGYSGRDWVQGLELMVEG